MIFFGPLFPLPAQERNVLGDGQPGRQEKALHDFFVHAGGRAQNPGADVGQPSELEQSLHGAIFAKRPVQHGKDDV